MPIDVVLGGVNFKTKKAIRERARDILYNSQLDTKLSDEDNNFMLSFIKRHQCYIPIIGCGLDYICVSLDKEHKFQRAFCVVRTDNEKVFFSYTKCIARPSNLTLFSKACRTCVQDQIDCFRRQAFNNQPTIICSLSGQIVTPQNCHIDHSHPTFEYIVKEFIKQKKIDVDDVTYGGDGRLKRFADVSMSCEFATLHREMAVLRVLSQQANLTRKRQR